MEPNPPGDAIAEIAGPESGPVVAAIAVSRIAVAAVAISRIATASIAPVAAVAISRIAVASVAAVAAVAITRIAVAGIQPEADDLSIPGLEAVHHHVGNRRVRYVASGAAGVRFEPGQGSASTTAVER